MEDFLVFILFSLPSSVVDNLEESMNFMVIFGNPPLAEVFPLFSVNSPVDLKHSLAVLNYPKLCNSSSEHIYQYFSLKYCLRSKNIRPPLF